MRLNLFYLIFISLLFPYECGSQLFPVLYNESYEPSRNREEKCLNHSIGDIVTFNVDTDLNSSTPNESIDFFLYNKNIEQEGCFYVDVSNDISNDDLDELWQLFFESTPNAKYDYIHGIKASEEAIFGPPPIINNISEVNVLFYDFNSENIRGYFNGSDQLCNDNEHNCSNIIYINADNQLENDFNRSAFTLAHEYQHLLHWAADQFEGNYLTNAGDEWYLTSPWLNEGLSDLAPYILGIGQRDFTPYLDNTYLSLDEWPLPSENVQNINAYYAKSALFVQYLWNLLEFFDFDGHILINLIFNDNQLQGIDSIIDILSLFDIDYGLIFNSWIINNIESYGISQNMSLENFFLNNTIDYNLIINNFKKNSSFNISIPKISNHVIDSIELIPTPRNSFITQNYKGLISGFQEDNSFFITVNNSNALANIDISIHITYKSSAARFNVYPNPLLNNHNQLFFSFDDQYKLPLSIIANSVVKIYNINGQLIETYKPFDSFDLSNEINFLPESCLWEDFPNSCSILLDLSKYTTGVYILNVDTYSEKFSIIK